MWRRVKSLLLFALKAQRLELALSAFFRPGADVVLNTINQGGALGVGVGFLFALVVLEQHARHISLLEVAHGVALLSSPMTAASFSASSVTASNSVYP